MPVPRLLGTLMLLAVTLGIAGCGSVSTQVPTWAGGLPPEAPQRQAAQPAFPNVHDLPPPRPDKLMSEQEQARIEAELKAIRNKVDAQTDAWQKEPTGGGR